MCPSVWLYIIMSSSIWDFWVVLITVKDKWLDLIVELTRVTWMVSKKIEFYVTKIRLWSWIQVSFKRSLYSFKGGNKVNHVAIYTQKKSRRKSIMVSNSSYCYPHPFLFCCMHRNKSNHEVQNCKALCIDIPILSSPFFLKKKKCFSAINPIIGFRLWTGKMHHLLYNYKFNRSTFCDLHFPAVKWLHRTRVACFMTFIFQW